MQPILLITAVVIIYLCFSARKYDLKYDVSMQPDYAQQNLDYYMVTKGLKHLLWLATMLIIVSSFYILSWVLHDVYILETIATCAYSMVSLAFMLLLGIKETTNTGLKNMTYCFSAYTEQAEKLSKKYCSDEEKQECVRKCEDIKESFYAYKQYVKEVHVFYSIIHVLLIVMFFLSFSSAGI